MKRSSNWGFVFLAGLFVGLVAGVLVSRMSIEDAEPDVLTGDPAPGQTQEPPSDAAAEALQAIGPDEKGYDLSSGGRAGTFELHNQYRSANRAVWFFGVLANTGKVSAKYKVNAVTKNAAGEEVGVAVGHLRRPKLDPGESAAMAILQSDAPEFETVEFEVVASDFYGSRLVVEGLEVSDWKIGGAEDKYSRPVSGKVHNRSGVDVRSTIVHLVALDAEDKVVGLTSVSADGDMLLAGQSARFTGYLSHHAPAVRWTQTVVARSAE